MPYALLPVHGRLFAGLGNGERWQSRDGGDSWSECRLEGERLQRIGALQAG
jgi:hypothetical protein